MYTVVWGVTFYCRRNVKIEVASQLHSISAVYSWSIHVNGPEWDLENHIGGGVLIRDFIFCHCCVKSDFCYLIKFYLGECLP